MVLDDAGSLDLGAHADTNERTDLWGWAWRPHLRPGAPVLFDDYTHPDYPGVREAIEELGLEGEQHGEFFIHRHTKHGIPGNTQRLQTVMTSA